MTYRYPFSAFPNGWFFVCYSHELSAEQLYSRTFMGKEIIAFRGSDGAACVADAYCPHLGAHLAKGGCVRDGAVQCPFHGFAFNAQGVCVSSPYSAPLKAGRLKLWHVHELDGFIFAYHDAAGRAPTWRIPAQDTSGWSALKTRAFRLRGHPQETTENGVDSGHLQVVHGYTDVQEIAPMRVEGPYLSGGYRMRRSAGPLALLRIDLETLFHVHVWGLGYSLVEVHVPAYGLRTRQWIFATPSDGEFIDLHIALRVLPLAQPEQAFSALRFVPSAVTTRIVRALVMKAFEIDIMQDFEIWENKGYVSPPALVKEDGPIGLYRRYCRQFYDQGPSLTAVKAG